MVNRGKIRSEQVNYRQIRTEDILSLDGRITRVVNLPTSALDPEIRSRLLPMFPDNHSAYDAIERSENPSRENPFITLSSLESHTSIGNFSTWRNPVDRVEDLSIITENRDGDCRLVRNNQSPEIFHWSVIHREWRPLVTQPFYFTASRTVIVDPGSPYTFHHNADPLNQRIIQISDYTEGGTIEEEFYKAGQNSTTYRSRDIVGLIDQAEADLRTPLIHDTGADQALELLPPSRFRFHLNRSLNPSLLIGKVLNRPYGLNNEIRGRVLISGYNLEDQTIDLTPSFEDINIEQTNLGLVRQELEASAVEIYNDIRLAEGTNWQGHAYYIGGTKIWQSLESPLNSYIYLFYEARNELTYFTIYDRDTLTQVQGPTMVSVDKIMELSATIFIEDDIDRIDFVYNLTIDPKTLYHQTWMNQKRPDDEDEDEDEGDYYYVYRDPENETKHILSPYGYCDGSGLNEMPPGEGWYLSTIMPYDPENSVNIHDSPVEEADGSYQIFEKDGSIVMCNGLPVYRRERNEPIDHSIWGGEEEEIDYREWLTIGCFLSAEANVILEGSQLIHKICLLGSGSNSLALLFILKNPDSPEGSRLKLNIISTESPGFISENSLFEDNHGGTPGILLDYSTATISHNSSNYILACGAFVNNDGGTIPTQVQECIFNDSGLSVGSFWDLGDRQSNDYRFRPPEVDKTYQILGGYRRNNNGLSRVFYCIQDGMVLQSIITSSPSASSLFTWEICTNLEKIHPNHEARSIKRIFPMDCVSNRSLIGIVLELDNNIILWQSNRYGNSLNQDSILLSPPQSTTKELGRRRDPTRSYGRPFVSLKNGTSPAFFSYVCESASVAQGILLIEEKMLFEEDNLRIENPNNPKPWKIPQARITSMVSEGEELFILGGYGGGDSKYAQSSRDFRTPTQVRPSEPRLFNDLWSYDIKEQSWSEISPDLEVLSPRVGHMLAYMGSLLYLFGGYTRFEGLQNPNNIIDDNSLYSITLNGRATREAQVQGLPPLADFKWIQWDQDTYLILGGLTSSKLPSNKIYLFKLNTVEVTELSPSSTSLRFPGLSLIGATAGRKSTPEGLDQDRGIYIYGGLARDKISDKLYWMSLDLEEHRYELEEVMSVPPLFALNLEYYEHIEDHDDNPGSRAFLVTRNGTIDGEVGSNIEYVIDLQSRNTLDLPQSRAVSEPLFNTQSQELPESLLTLGEKNLISFGGYLSREDGFSNTLYTRSPPKFNKNGLIYERGNISRQFGSLWITLETMQESGFISNVLIPHHGVYQPTGSIIRLAVAANSTNQPMVFRNNRWEDITTDQLEEMGMTIENFNTIPRTSWSHLSSSKDLTELYILVGLKSPRNNDSPSLRSIMIQYTSVEQYKVLGPDTVEISLQGPRRTRIRNLSNRERKLHISIIAPRTVRPVQVEDDS